MRLTLAQIAALTGGTREGDDVLINSVSSDTRTLRAGQLFIALRGAHFDGDRFAAQAQQAGAAAVLVHARQDIDLPQVVVADTRAALSALARHQRRHCRAKVIALTGSNGKTTTKELLQRLLATRGKVLATAGNRNNDIGVPLTLLDLEEEDEFAVIEMGANHQGEIAQLVAVAEPDVVLVTNVSAAHLAGFGSLSGVIRGKEELYAASATAAIILNQDLDCAAQWQARYASRVARTFGLGNAAEVSARAIAADGRHFTLYYAGDAAQVSWQLVGQHNIANALAAFAAASVFGVTVADAARAWQDLRLTHSRLTAHRVARHTLYDDTYNANPASFRAGIDVLAARSPSLVVAGAMGELGGESARLHRQVAAYARNCGIGAFWCVGADARQYGVEDGFIRHFDDAAVAAAALRRWLAADGAGAVLVKGSRSARMERVLALAGIDDAD